MKAAGLRAASTPKKAAATLKSMGRRGDTELVHVNRKELAILEKLTGSKKRNPKTGLREFWAAETDTEAAAAQNAGFDTNAGMGSGAPSGAAERGLRDRLGDWLATKSPLDFSMVLSAGKAAFNGLDDIAKENLEKALEQGRVVDKNGNPMSKEEAMAALQNGTVTVKGEGLFGETTTMGVGPGGINNGGRDGAGGGAGAGGNEDAGGETVSRAANTAPTEEEKPPLNADRPRVITPGTGATSTRAFVQEALSRARRNLGGGDPVPELPPPSPPPIALSSGDAAMPQSRGLERIRNLVAGSGRRGDTEAVHLSPALQRLLERMGGSGDVNPATGMKEFAPDPLRVNTGAQMAADGADGPNSGDNLGPGYEDDRDAKQAPTDPDISGFNALADEYNRIGGQPLSARADLYANLVGRRNSLLEGYNDDQLGAVSGRYYGGVGRVTGLDGRQGFLRQQLLDHLARSDSDWYKSLGPTPNDTITPPTTTPPGPVGTGGGGTITVDSVDSMIGRPGSPERIRWEEDRRREREEMERRKNGGGGGENIGTITNWLNTNLPGMLKSITPAVGQAATPGGLNAISASTNLVRSPVASRRFRSRRFRSQKV